MRELAGKTALVTGAAGGIGLAIAEALQEAGMAVAIADLDAARLAEAAQSLGAGPVLALSLDIRDSAAWVAAADRAEAELGPIAVLVNNAGVTCARGPFVDVDPQDWRTLLEINIGGAMHGVQAVAPRMIARCEGHIVNTASMQGLFAAPFSAAYNTSKFAMVGFSETLRGELAGEGVGVSVLCPGAVATDFRRNAQAILKGEDAPPIGGLGYQPMPMMDPAFAGRRVVQGIRDNDFHIITHPEYRPVVEMRAQRLLGAFGDPAQPGHADDTSVIAGAAVQALYG